uniref:Uncharacterized protein n=2 Tax=Salix viminalis TaxID=40686 RepID=A0A6N2M604_SALVM
MRLQLLGRGRIWILHKPLLNSTEFLKKKSKINFVLDKQTEEKEEQGFIIVIRHVLCHLVRIIYLLHERYPQRSQQCFNFYIFTELLLIIINYLISFFFFFFLIRLDIYACVCACLGE